METLIKETIAQEAKTLLESVPANEWITERITNGKDKCCALGHYARLKSERPHDYKVSNLSADNWKTMEALREASAAYISATHDCYDVDIASVNNAPGINGYTEPEIKDRVMHLLDDMILAGY